MERIEEINKKMLLLKKRFREDQMKEIFLNTPNKSLIQIFENVHGSGNKPIRSFGNGITIGGGIGGICSIGSTRKVNLAKKNEEMKSEAENSVDAIANTSATPNNPKSNLNCLIDQNLPRTSSTEKRSTTSTGSGKSSKKQKNENVKEKKPTSKKKSPKMASKPLPPDNLLYFDQRQNLDKNASIKSYKTTYTATATNNKTNDVKKEVITKSEEKMEEKVGDRVEKIERVDKISNNSNNTNTINEVSSNELKIQSNSPTVVNATSTAARNETVKMDESRINPNCNINNDDDYFSEEKEELFSHTLPPEAMGGSPEMYEKEERNVCKVEEEEESVSQTIQIKTEEKTTPMISKSNIILPNPNLKETVKDPSKEVNTPLTKITLPNTFNNEVVLKTNSTSQSQSARKNLHYKQKQVKIIDDDEDEQEYTNSNYNYEVVKDSQTQPQLQPKYSMDVVDEEKEKESIISSNFGSSNKIKIPIFEDLPDKEKNTHISGKVNFSLNSHDKIEIDKKRLSANVKNILNENNASGNSNAIQNSHSKQSTPRTPLTPVTKQKAPSSSLKTKTFNKIKESMQSLPVSETLKVSSSNTNSISNPNNINNTPISSSIYPNYSEPIEIEKVDDSKYFLKNFLSCLHKIQEKYMSKKSIQDVENLAEFESVLNSVNQLTKNETNNTIEKTAKNIIKLIGIMTKVEQTENNNIEVIIF